LTLDDGQIVQGVTSGLGELQMVTSNVAAFGVVELMSQSAPEDVIGVTHVAVYRDTELPPPPTPLVPARRTAQIGGRTASTPEEGATTKAQAPDFIGCDPLNFGLRTYRYLKSAKPDDEERTFDYRSNVEYPVPVVPAAFTILFTDSLIEVNRHMLEERLDLADYWIDSETGERGGNDMGAGYPPHVRIHGYRYRAKDHANTRVPVDVNLDYSDPDSNHPGEPPQLLYVSIRRTYEILTPEQRKQKREEKEQRARDPYSNPRAPR
ncbi:MAG: hypothetical protein LBV73_11035, partial [Paraburkholderia sp.]|nr:hypothetical protein [Paraburkholderia sp.]